MCIDLLPEKLLQAIKKKKKTIWTEHLCHKFYRRLHWYHNYYLVMQRFLKVTFSYQPVNYLEFKLWIMTKSKTKTKMILMEQINSLKTIISTAGGSLSHIFKWRDLWLLYLKELLQPTFGHL